MNKNIPKKFTPWLFYLGVIAVLLFILFYAFLGHLRFFVNHWFGLTMGQKEYLVLFQNNNELRPGGGFITAYADFKVSFGIPTELSFHNSYEIDTKTYVKPPYPHEEMLKNEWYQGYTFRDANWSPHFPDAAKEIVRFYKQKFPESDIDGIAVVNFSLIESFLKNLGTIQIGSENIDHNNLFSALEFSVNNIDRHNLEDLKNRKGIMKDLASLLIKRMIRHPFKAVRVLNQAIDEKDLYFWFQDTSLEAKILLNGWGNDLFLAEKNDFLGINVANLGSKKADRYLIKNTEYYVDLSSPVPTMHVKVALNYPGKLNGYSDPYRGYLRVIIPGSATITHQPPGSRIEELGALTSIGVIVRLDEKSASELTFDYTLPRSAFRMNQYALRLHKQSGDPMNTLVVVSGANETQLKSELFDVRENKAFFRGILKNDLGLSLMIKPDKTPPYPLEQVFDSLNRISIIWSEPVDTGTADFKIQDINVTDSKTTDVVRIESFDTEQNITRLKLSGVTTQAFEQYQIMMNDVRDKNGNFIQSNPKRITVVQRFK